MSRSSILVTGGAGYIGSHTVLQLRARGEQVVVLDDLSTGFRQAVLDTPLVVGKVGDRDLVMEVLRTHGVDTVMHFAAHTIVPESVSNPLKYYGNNTCSTRNLLECCVETGVKHFVFSSTAAVYGIPADSFAAETSPTAPDQCLRHLQAHVRVDAARCSGLLAAAICRLALLQCGGLGYRRPDRPGDREGHPAGQGGLRGRGRQAPARVRSTARTIATADGTGVRDYIHVEDLATAHLDALSYLRKGGTPQVLNVGYGHGYSVREVLKSVERVAGARPDHPRGAAARRRSAHSDRPRRPNPDRAGLAPRLDDLDTIVKTSLQWEQRLAREPW